MNLPSYSVDPSQTRIVIKGIESDPLIWTTYQKLGIYRFWGPAHLGKMWTIPYPSTLTYNVTQLKFNTSENTSSPVMKKPTTDERMMIQAALMGDYARVKASLDAGVNVNAADEYGHTALMHAALMMDYKIENLLLERGADVTKMDHGGYPAIYFRTFPFRPVDRSLYVLDKKYKALPKDQTVIQE